MTSRIIIIGFALSKWPHLHRAYVLGASIIFSATVIGILLIPIPTERGQIWPGWPNPVWHFHILMVRVAKLHDFVSFYICQVSERSFFEKRKSIFEKSKKMIWQFQHQRVPPLDKNRKKSKFFSFLKKIILLYLNMN